jgi:hypothetical protein
MRLRSNRGFIPSLALKDQEKQQETSVRIAAAQAKNRTDHLPNKITTATVTRLAKFVRFEPLTAMNTKFAVFWL